MKEGRLPAGDGRSRRGGLQGRGELSHSGAASASLPGLGLRQIIRLWLRPCPAAPLRCYYTFLMKCSLWAFVHFEP